MVLPSSLSAGHRRADLPFLGSQEGLEFLVEIGGAPAGVDRQTITRARGAPRLTLFPNRMQSRLPGFLLKGVRTGQGTGGRSQLREVELAAVRLGPTEWRHVGALLVDVAASSFNDFDGVLAPSSLSVRSL